MGVGVVDITGGTFVRGRHAHPDFVMGTFSF